MAPLGLYNARPDAERSANDPVRLDDVDGLQEVEPHAGDREHGRNGRNRAGNEREDDLNHNAAGNARRQNLYHHGKYC